MPISGDRPAHRGTLVAFWSWWWGYPLSFAFLFALCPQAQKVWGVQLCRWAPHVPMPTSYAVVDCLCTEWFDDSYVQRLQALRSWGKGSHDFTPHELFVYLLMITGTQATQGYGQRWCFNIVLCDDNRGGSVNATHPWATQHDGFFRMDRPSHGYEELYEPDCWLCRCI